MAGPDESPRPLAEWSSEEAELLRGLFLEEAERHLRQIVEAQKALIVAGSAAAQRELVETLLRQLHTLKGSAGSVGFTTIAQATHDLEELYAEIHTGQATPTAGLLDRLDEAVAGLRALLDGARATPARQREGDESGPVSLERRRSNDRRTALDRRHGSVRVEADRLDALLEDVGDLVILRTRIERRLRELEGVLRDLHHTRTSLRTAAAIPDLGALLDRAGEVEVEFTDAISFLERATSALSQESDGLRRTTDHLEEQLRHARLVPLDWVFSRLAAALRELDRTSGRHTELVTHGADIELDKSVVEQLGEPLLHLLRNSVAHGIEPAAERTARGKPAQGRIEVAARQEGDLVTVTVADDGRGIDREAVRQALVRLGQLTPEAPLTEGAMQTALFEAGVSSRATSDALAGRGMGLDIVKKALMRLGGDVRLEYQAGTGTQFELTVPVAAAITQALLFKLGGQVYAIPAAHVVEAVPLGADDLPISAPRTDAAAALPFLRLHALLGTERPPGRRGAALHVRYGARSFLVSCDRIVGPRTIVVRPLGPLLGLLPFYAGVTVSGAGKAQLVLDLAALADAAHAPVRAPILPQRRGQARILVVDDSRLSREAAARALTSAGYHPITAEDGFEAWEMLGESRFDAVVTDLEMPRLDGFELIARIRSEPTLRNLPVVVLSSRTSQVMQARALRVGANAVLPKAPGKRGLGDAVAALLGPPAQV